MSDSNESELDAALSRFAELERLAAHLEGSLLRSAPLGTPAEHVLPVGASLDEALLRFSLLEHERAVLLADGGLGSDLVVWLAGEVGKIDPVVRSAFPSVNAFLEGLAATIPGGGTVAHLLLILAEGPGLSLVESWLSSRAKAILERRRAAGAS